MQLNLHLQEVLVDRLICRLAAAGYIDPVLGLNLPFLETLAKSISISDDAEIGTGSIVVTAQLVCHRSLIRTWWWSAPSKSLSELLID
jgi:hypothetical protein